jgi:hypothetical protein
MSQVCPKCGAKHLTWSIDSDTSRFTQWRCGNCSYTAHEDETREADCPRCAAARSSMLLKDSKGFHRWCSQCGCFESTTESFAT